MLASERFDANARKKLLLNGKLLYEPGTIQTLFLGGKRTMLMLDIYKHCHRRSPDMLPPEIYFEIYEETTVVHRSPQRCVAAGFS